MVDLLLSDVSGSSENMSCSVAGFSFVSILALMRPIDFAKEINPGEDRPGPVQAKMRRLNLNILKKLVQYILLIYLKFATR